MDRLLVATMNILNLADRWDERLPLLLADMAALQPDLIGLNEVVFPMQQDRILGAAGEGRYETVRGWAGRPEYGNSILVKAPLEAGDADRLELGHNRSAIRIRVVLPGRRPPGVRGRAPAPSAPPTTSCVRRRSTRCCPGSTASPEHEAMIVVGDFNAGPGEPAAQGMRAAGFASALPRPTAPILP